MYEVLYTFSDSCAWRPLLMLQSDLLQCHEVVRQLTPPLEDRSVRALEDRKRRKEVRKGLSSWTDAAQSGCQGLKVNSVPVCVISLAMRTWAPVKKSRLTVNTHSHVPPPVCPVWCRSPASQIQFLTGGEKRTNSINEGGVFISTDKLTDTTANPSDGLAATEGGCKEVTHPQPTSELISCDKGPLAFGFYNVFVYRGGKANFIYKASLIHDGKL